MAKAFTREFRFELSGLMTFIGVFLTVVGAIGIFAPHPPSYLAFLAPVTKISGNWVYWYMILGPLLIVGGVWWLADSIKKTRQLLNFLKIDSKAKFVKNIDEIEYLAWVLPRRYEEMVIDKKRQFKL